MFAKFIFEYLNFFGDFLTVTYWQAELAGTQKRCATCKLDFPAEDFVYAEIRLRSYCPECWKTRSKAKRKQEYANMKSQRPLVLTGQLYDQKDLDRF